MDSSSTDILKYDDGFALAEDIENNNYLVIGCTRSSSKRPSHSSSFASASAETDRYDYVEETSQTCGINLQDAQTGSKELKLANTSVQSERVVNLVLAVNDGINIDPTPVILCTSKSTTSDGKRKPVKLRSIIKDTSIRPGTAISLSNSEKACVARKTSSISSLAEAKKRRREKNAAKVLPHTKQTYQTMGADYGFPASISISSILGNFMGMTPWTSKNTVEKEDERGVEDETGSVEKNDSNTSVVICGRERREGGGSGGGEEENNSLIGTAFDILTAGLKFASGFIGDEADLVPKEDTIFYKGYTVKVVGKKLLLESMHVNCDFGLNDDEMLYESTHSLFASRPYTPSRGKLEDSCEGRRIRIVVRLNGPPSSSSSSPTNLKEEDEVVNSIMHGKKHRICLDDGKWTIIYEKKNSGGRTQAGDNFVEITCPTGVNPENLAYRFANGRLLIDAP